MEELKFIEEEIKDLLELGEDQALVEILADLDSVEIEEAVYDLDNEDIIRVLRLLPKEMMAEVFEEFDHYNQADLASLLEEEELIFLANELYFDDKIDLIQVLPEDLSQIVIDNSHFTERKLIDKFLMYPEDSAGSIMTIEFMVLKEWMTVIQALDHIKKVGMTKETIYTCYITDKTSALVGILSLRDLVTSNKDDVLKDIMNTDVVAVKTSDDKEEVADMFLDYGFLSMPVIDSKNHLQGIVTADDIIEVMEEETTEDFHRMAAISPHEEDYLDISAFDLAKNRVFWLLLLLVTSTFTGAIIASFESMLAKVTVLSVYMPMLMSAGGNSGNQASATVIRGIATGEIEVTDGMRVFIKESSVAIICSLVMALVIVAKLLFFDRVGILVAMTVALTLIFTVLLAKVMGGMLPLIAEKRGLDPAIMAGPLISTLIDTTSLLLYFQFANAIIGL